LAPSACDGRPAHSAAGRIGWQVLLMLARAAGALGVTKQYELVRKAEISPMHGAGPLG
jgi:hypothetical protein